MEGFLELSILLTGFDRLDLEGSGQVAAYFREIERSIAAPVCNRLWTLAHELYRRYRDQPDLLNAMIKREIMSDGLLGPLAQNIISLWYLGIWYALPWYWWLQHGIGAANETRVVSTEAYKEGLIWRAMGTHPPGAKQPGYGSWSLPPQIETESR